MVVAAESRSILEPPRDGAKVESHETPQDRNHDQVGMNTLTSHSLEG